MKERMVLVLRSLSASVLIACVALSACASSTGPASTPAGATPVGATPAGASTTKQRKSSIDALDYAVSCSKDSECGTIYEGDACQACRCPNAAIQAQALEQYRRDLMRFDSCHQPERCGADCAASIGEPAQCRQGRCTWVPPG